MNDNSTVEYQNIEHQQISDEKLVTENHSNTSTGRPHRDNSGKGVIILNMTFNGNSYDNVKFTSIRENKEHDWSHYCLRIAANFMFTQMPEKKGFIYWRRVQLYTL